MKKLGINIAAGVLDIIAIVFYFIVMFSFAGYIVEVEGNPDSSSIFVFMFLLLIFTIVCIVLHIVGLVQSKQIRMKISGNVVGIVGHPIYFLSEIIVVTAGDVDMLLIGAGFSFIAIILVTISAIFTLRNNKIFVHHTTR